jgi:hypothetical protein
VTDEESTAFPRHGFLSFAVLPLRTAITICSPLASTHKSELCARIDQEARKNMDQDEAEWLAPLMQRESWIFFAYPISDSSRKTDAILSRRRKTRTILWMKTLRVWAKIKLTKGQEMQR